jgi:nitrite reductase/ring-hydroxylating ferredoxin subunit
MTMNSCEPNNACGVSALNSTASGPRPGAIDLNPALSRRAWLSGVASVLGTLGLTSAASAAQAAAKTVKLGNAADVPLKSAKSYYVGIQYILVTQPAKGVYKAFSGVCTHQTVNLTNISGSNLVCAEHGSTFDTTTGKVTGGPAPTGLKKYPLTIKAGALYITV